MAEDNSEKNTGYENLKPWKKGESGNPNGRPKGQRNFATIYRKALEKIADLEEITPEELEDDIIAEGVEAARKRDYRFYKDLLDRLDGQAVKRTDLTTDGKPLPFSINVNFTDFGSAPE